MANKTGRPVGKIVNPLPVGNVPDLRPIHGRWVRMEHVSAAKHAGDLYASFYGKDPDGDIWTYMPYGPFETQDVFTDWVKQREATRDPWFYAITRRDTNKAVGMGAFMRNDATNGVIEIGNIWMSPELQQTREATEAIYLMMRYCFDDLGVRRLEWKCDSLNAPSRKAADRFGFTYEGTFRQHYIIKGRNRDTAWFAMLDTEWPSAHAAFEAWLKDDNFDDKGIQKAKLQVKSRTANQRPEI